ncbi:hypothetical protein TcWFU_003065 [Taenia crassiceps]|uniref:Envelope protein n=1 Tax=Taenia crassiceps TaxID=6207 RepID=A0ABR4QPR3_9CEST
MRIRLSITLEALITLAVLCLLVFRIFVWWRAEGTQGKSSTKGEGNLNQDLGTEAILPSLTFCNANPLRATALYYAGLYDKVSQAVQDPRFTLQDLDFSYEQLQQYAHSIFSMLKRCKLNNAECNARSFESVRTKHGMCFQLQIPRRKTIAPHNLCEAQLVGGRWRNPRHGFVLRDQTHLEIILDPEESEYVLPNDGFTGFLIVLNCSTSDQGEFFIGSGFHNMVRISSAAPHFGVACGSGGSQLRVDSITQTVRSALYQSFLPRDVLGDSTAEAEREALSRLIQQRAFLRSMNRTAFKEVVQLSHDLTSIRVAAGFIADLMRQATHALKVETTIVPQQSGCSADLNHIASRLLVDFLEAQERWSDFFFTSATSSTYTSGLMSDDASLVNTSAKSDVELRLVECFFAAQSIGTRLQSHLRDLIQSLLEIYSPRGLNLDPRSSERISSSPAQPLLSSREVFQPLSASELLAAGNATVCRRVQGVYRARTALLGERASAVVALIDRLNARLHTLTAENRETRAHFSLSQSARHNTPYLVARYVTATISVKEQEQPTSCYTSYLRPFHRFDHLIGILSSTVSLWLTLILVIELHCKNFRDRRARLLRLHRLPLDVGTPNDVTTTAASVHENNSTPLPEEAYEHCNLVASQSMPPKLIQIGEGDPPEMWLTVPTSMFEMTTHSLQTPRMPPTMFYKRHTSQKPSKTTCGHVALLEPSASTSSSTQTVILDNLQNRF